MEQLITNLGFPVAVACACGYFIWHTTQQQREDNKTIQKQIMEDSKQREDRMFAQLDKFGDSLDSFNTTLIKIDTRLEAVEKKVSGEEK
ncbi:hypothetical protein [Clostridium sp.]|uniref:hypothetical protein n=1 Tax=Clostridium sp. TaxID=1506 RepID=UPI003993E586